MAGRYAIPVQMNESYFGGGGGCGGGNDDDDGDGGGGCGYCYPGDEGPIPSWFNPWGFCVVDYPAYAEV